MKIRKAQHIDESILDFPQDDLCPAIWQKNEDGSYSMTPKAEQTIQAIVNWAQAEFKIPDMNVNITGSITSNSYSERSDVDIHFSSPKLKKDKVDEFNKIFKKKFEIFKAQNPQYAEIDGYKTEIYMQANPFQDLMSVGCYDFLNKIWLVGPEFKDISFDPYAEYFNVDIKNVKDILPDVRNIILEMYELAIALVHATDNDFKKQTSKKFLSSMSKAARLMQKIRNARKHKSSPKDAKEAMKFRDDKEWKIADSSFKLLDKFGYLKVLTTAVKMLEDDIDPIEAARQIVQQIDDRLSVDSLNEIDDDELDFQAKLFEIEQAEQLNESFASMMRLSALAALMAIPSILPAKHLADSLAKAKAQTTMMHQQFKLDAPLVQRAIVDTMKDEKTIGDMKESQVANAVTQVLWKEARGEGEAGLRAVASVIWNRADKNPEYFVPVIKEKDQFSCLNSYSGGWTTNSYQWFNPSFNELASQTNAWRLCKDIASEMLNKTFKSTIGNMNSYLNKTTAKKSAVDSWGRKCNHKVGKHYFGYLPEHDPKYVVPGTMITWKDWNKQHKPVIIVVKNGDTLGKIAKANNTTIQKILSLNNQIADPNKISVGQKIRIA